MSERESAERELKCTTIQISGSGSASTSLVLTEKVTGIAPDWKIPAGAASSVTHHTSELGECMPDSSWKMLVHHRIITAVVALSASLLRLPMNRILVLDSVDPSLAEHAQMVRFKGFPIVACGSWRRPSMLCVRMLLSDDQGTSIVFGPVALQIQVPIKHHSMGVPVSRAPGEYICPGCSDRVPCVEGSTSPDDRCNLGWLNDS